MILAILSVIWGAGCVDPRIYGAVVNDGLDDTAAVQAAYNQACADGRRKVCLPQGQLDFTRKQLTGTANIPNLIVGCGKDSIETFGGGQSGATKSTLAMAGNGNVLGVLSNWYLLEDTNGTGDWYHDFEMTGSTRSAPTDDQTHVFVVNGPSNGVTVERMHIEISHQVGNDGGDCFNTRGLPGSEVANVTIRDVDANPCKRAVIVPGRRTYGLTMLRVNGVGVTDQVFDIETSDEVNGVLVQDSTFSRTGGFAGISVSIDGASPQVPASNIVFKNTTITDGGVFIDNAKNVTFDTVSINSGTISTSPVVSVFKFAQGILFTNCTIVRPAGAPDAQAFLVFKQVTRPTDVTITNGSISNATKEHLFMSQGLDYLTITGTTFAYTGPAFSTLPLIEADGHASSFGDIQGLTISGINVTSSADIDGMVRVSAFTQAGILSVTGSTITGGTANYALTVLGSAQSITNTGNTINP